MSVDIGSSGIRGAVFDAEAGIADGSLFKRTNLLLTSRSASDPGDFVESVLEVLDEIAAWSEQQGIYPKAASFSCFWHSLVGIDRSLNTSTPLFDWSETRAAGAAALLGREIDEAAVHNRTGCHFHSSYWPAKLKWIADEFLEEFENSAYWLSFSDLLNLRLTGRIVTSVSMASGTGLFDLRNCEWDPEMVRVAGIRESQLPEICQDSVSFFLRADLRERWPALRDTRFFPAIADGAANNVGSGCTDERSAVIMVGTSAAFRVVYEGNIPNSIPEGLFCYRLDSQRPVLGGALSDGGGLFKWLTEDLGLLVDPRVLKERAENTPGYHGLSMLPLVFGERSTGYHDEAKGSLIGLTRGSDTADIVLASLEGICFRLKEICERTEIGFSLERIVAAGGAIESSPVLAKLIADIIGKEIQLSKMSLASLSGAAIYGLEASGIATPLESVGRSGLRTISPDPDRHREYEKEFSKHRRFYDRMIP